MRYMLAALLESLLQNSDVTAEFVDVIVAVSQLGAVLQVQLARCQLQLLDLKHARLALSR